MEEMMNAENEATNETALCDDELLDFNEADLLKKIRRFAEIKKQISCMEAEIKGLKAEANGIDADCSEYMAINNPRIRVRSGGTDAKPEFMTVHVMRTLAVGLKVDKEVFAEKMKRNGLESLVKETYNEKTLQAYVKGLDPDGTKTTDQILELLPEELSECLTLQPIIRMGVKKG